MNEVPTQAEFIAKAETLAGGTPLDPDVAAAQLAHQEAHRPPHPEKPPAVVKQPINEQLYSD